MRSVGGWEVKAEYYREKKVSQLFIYIYNSCLLFCVFDMQQ